MITRIIYGILIAFTLLARPAWSDVGPGSGSGNNNNLAEFYRYGDVDRTLSRIMVYPMLAAHVNEVLENENFHPLYLREDFSGRKIPGELLFRALKKAGLKSAADTANKDTVRIDLRNLSCTRTA